MSKNPYRQEREELKELLELFNNLKEGRANSFIEEEGFARIIEYFSEKEEYEPALEVVGYAIRQYPYSAGLLLQKADILISLKKYRQAIFILEKAELLDSTDSNLYIFKTDAYLALDMQAKAAQVLEEAIDNFEGEEKIDLLFELCDVYDDYEDFQKVFDCLKLIIELDPENEEALYKICFWTDFTGRNEEGIRIHQRILDDYPYNTLAWFNLAAAYQGLKLYEKSIDAYLYAVAIDDKFDYAYRNMGDAYIKLKKYKEAIEVLSRVLELSRPEAVIYEAIGHCYDRLTNFAQARFHYKKAVHLNPEDSQMYFKIALTYMNGENWISAIKNLEVSLKKHALQPEYNLAMGRCLMETGKIEEAIKFLGNVVRLRPKNSKGWTELLRAMYSGGFFEEGFECSALAFEQTEFKPIFIYYKSLFLFAMGKSKEALIWLEKGIAANQKLIKQFIEINPALLQHQQVVELIARNKKKKSR